MADTKSWVWHQGWSLAGVGVPAFIACAIHDSEWFVAVVCVLFLWSHFLGYWQGSNDARHMHREYQDG